MGFVIMTGSCMIFGAQGRTMELEAVKIIIKVLPHIAAAFMLMDILAELTSNE